MLYFFCILYFVFAMSSDTSNTLKFDDEKFSLTAKKTKDNDFQMNIKIIGEGFVSTAKINFKEAVSSGYFTEECEEEQKIKQEVNDHVFFIWSKIILKMISQHLFTFASINHHCVIVFENEIIGSYTLKIPLDRFQKEYVLSNIQNEGKLKGLVVELLNDVERLKKQVAAQAITEISFDYYEFMKSPYWKDSPFVTYIAESTFRNSKIYQQLVESNDPSVAGNTFLGTVEKDDSKFFAPNVIYTDQYNTRIRQTFSKKIYNLSRKEILRLKQVKQGVWQLSGTIWLKSSGPGALPEDYVVKHNRGTSATTDDSVINNFFAMKIIPIAVTDKFMNIFSDYFVIEYIRNGLGKNNQLVTNRWVVTHQIYLEKGVLYLANIEMYQGDRTGYGRKVTKLTKSDDRSTYTTVPCQKLFSVTFTRSGFRITFKSDNQDRSLYLR